MTNITNALAWRYATKKFDATKKLSEETVQKLKESVRLSPSSYGLQPFTVIDVQSPELREKLKAASYGQTQLTDASHVFIFAVPTDITDKDVDVFMQLNADIRNIPLESLQGYAAMIKGSVQSRTPEQRSIWAAKQAYIALGFLLETAALLEIDATPMEGFVNAQIDEVLGLGEKGLTSAVICTLGYRAEDDETAHYPKVRKSESDMFMTM